jgi:LysR family transcriptional regulator, transcriptional activator of nhaA
MNNLNLHHLRYFWAVAHEGNLTRAAEKMNVSQSSLSVQVKQLEDRLGHALFERNGRRLQLTEAGRLALDHADRIFATAEELVDSISTQESARKTLRIGALSTLSRNFQIRFLKPFLPRRDTEVILIAGNTSDLLSELAGLNLDLVLLNQPAPSDGARPFISHKLSEQQISLIGTPTRLQRQASLEELLSEEPLILPPPGTGIRTGFDAIIGRMGIIPNIAAEVDDMAMIRLLARENAGLAIIPPIVVMDELMNGTLVEVTILPEVVESFYAITVDRRFPNPLAISMLRHFQEAEARR